LRELPHAVRKDEDASAGVKVRILLGSGTSSGVPRIGNDWGDCDPNDPRNRRTRASVLVTTETTTILVDTSPDMREQLLAADISPMSTR
jgi:phosphoribosyl 1,2-cyclic phosphate phosphodiesterase